LCCAFAPQVCFSVLNLQRYTARNEW
jgi:hypothetical protein